MKHLWSVTISYLRNTPDFYTGEERQFPGCDFNDGGNAHIREQIAALAAPRVLQWEDYSDEMRAYFHDGSGHLRTFMNVQYESPV